MIFKLQRAVASTDADPPILVYNRDRSIVVQLTPTPELDALMGEAKKVYAHAVYLGRARFTWGEIAPAQDW